MAEPSPCPAGWGLILRPPLSRASVGLPIVGKVDIATSHYRDGLLGVGLKPTPVDSRLLPGHNSVNRVSDIKDTEAPVSTSILIRQSSTRTEWEGISCFPTSPDTGCSVLNQNSLLPHRALDSWFSVIGSSALASPLLVHCSCTLSLSGPSSHIGGI